MKKVLLATSALFLTAGVASAELTFSGTAAAGIFKQGKKADGTAAVAAAAGAVTAAQITAHNTAAAAGAAATGALAAGAVTNEATGDTMLTELNAERAAEVAAYANIAMPSLAEQSAHAAALASFDALIAAARGTAAKAAVANTPAADHYSVYSGIDINIKASTTTDNGMTISAATDMGAGSILDAADRELDAQTDALTAPEVKISYSGVTVELESEGVQDYYDGDLSNYDVGISGSMGGISYGIALETNRNEGADTGVDSDWSAMASYSANGLTFSVMTNEVNGSDDLTKVVASYAMGDLTVTLANDSVGKEKDISKLTVAYAAGPATFTVSAANDKDHAKNTNKSKRQSYDVSVKYVTGAYTINATTNESDAWNANVAYDLGGGATMTVGADSTETSFAGVSFAF